MSRNVLSTSILALDLGAFLVHIAHSHILVDESTLLGLFCLDGPRASQLRTRLGERTDAMCAASAVGEFGRGR